MSVDLSDLRVSATKPSGKPAVLLAQMGIGVLSVVEDEGNVDRYIISPRLAIERRTGSSFLRGIMDKTLFTSAVFLREHFELPILIVEGEVNYEYSGFDPQAVRGALSAMMLEYGISVLSTASTVETASLIAMMARQEQIGIPEISMIPKRKATDLLDLQRRVIEMLPECGMTLARELLQHFGSVERIVAASQEELLQCRGVGERKAAQIHQVLHAQYHAVDTERNLEDAVEAAPDILFDEPVTLLARQHHIYTEEKERHVVDLVFLDVDAREIILVELKRGRLSREHREQIRRYLDNACKSKVLRELLDEGMTIRGLLATVEEDGAKLKIKDKNISACVVDRQRAIEVLAGLREARLRCRE